MERRGHEIVALIADHYLDPAVKQKVHAMLAADTDNLSAHDIASAATWADKYRDSDLGTTKVRHSRTQSWHTVDIEIQHPDIDAACFGHPAIPPGTPASAGPANDCIVDKIGQFAAELGNPATSKDERLIALKFLLHLVGDVHQPLYASDNHDAGGSEVEVSGSDFHPTNLRHFWDVDVIEEMGDDPKPIADDLIGALEQNKAQAGKWSGGSPSDWAQDSFRQARDKIYGTLPESKTSGGYYLDATYVTKAIELARTQLAEAGLRLAATLNRAMK